MSQFLLQKAQQFFATIMLSLACWFLVVVIVVAYKMAPQATMPNKNQTMMAEDKMAGGKEIIAVMPVEKIGSRMKTFAIAKH